MTKQPSSAPPMPLGEGVLSPRETMLAAAASPSESHGRIAPPTEDEFPASVAKSREALLEEAEMVATSAVQRYPESPLAQAILAAWQMLTNQDSEAEQTWRKVLAMDNRFLDAYEALIQLATKRKDYDEIVRLARSAVELAPKQEFGYLHLVDALSAQGKDEEAVAVLEEYASLNPNPSLKVQKLRVKILLRLGQYAEAEKLLEAIPSHLVDPELAQLRADLAAAQGNSDQAQRYLEQAENAIVSKQPIKQSTRANLTPPDIEKLLTDVALLETKAAKMYYVYRDFIRTEIYLRRAIALDPNCHEAHRALVAFYQEQKRYSQMEKALEEWLRAEPDNLQIYVGLATCYGGRRDFDKTEAILQEAVHRFPENPLPLAMLARLYIDAQRKTEQAVPLAEKVVKLQPVAVNFQLLAEALEAVGRIDEAIGAIEQAIKLDPHQPFFTTIQQRLLQKAGKKPTPVKEGNTG
ncbi:tetratricopeptide repeat protein [Thermogutta sp.]|uniref:tetratricopeptide repeat protein n=1 Tax=Thermogutta sp. TaxID=1962930 RepID=UPI0032206945